MSSRGTSDYGTGPPPANGRQRSRSGTGQPHQTQRELLENDRLPLLTDEEAIYSSDSMEYTIDFPKPNNQHNAGGVGEEFAIAENLLSDGRADTYNPNPDVDPFNVHQSFQNCTSGNENPKIGKVMRQLPADVKEATLNDQRSAAHHKWEDQKKQSWLTSANQQEHGLTDEEVNAKQEEEGFNELPQPTVARFYQIFFKHLLQAPPLCLIGQGILYAALMQWVPGVLNFLPG
jgi:magnesium-transporting ATPase (P-type)